MSSPGVTPSVFDLNGLVALKRQAKADDPAALKAAAQQFEALFLQLVLKSMRDATSKEGLFDSEQTRLYESLLDQQMSQVLATKGRVGLASVIERQLSRSADTDPLDFPEGLPLVPPAPRPLPLDAPTPHAMSVDASVAAPVLQPMPSMAAPMVSAGNRDFVGKVWPHAVEASRATGIPPAYLVAQAALETGWGRAEPRRADGTPSYNVFGIKAGGNWSGATVEASTTEYVGGVPRQRVERFRAYGSYAEAFRDYASLMSTNSRYAGVLGAGDASLFAQALQRAGYATDPAYAAKLVRVIGTLGTTA